MSAPPSGRYLEGMRLSERERSVLIEQMRKSGVADRRKHPRIITEGTFSVLLTLETPGSNPAYFRIYPWDLSRGGVGFFHRAFVYPGTRCTYTGLTSGGQPFTVQGEVVRCSHISGNVHAVGTRLDSEIDPEIILGNRAHESPLVAAQTAKTEDWWERVATLANEMSRLARDRVSPDTIRGQLAKLTEHASTQPGARPAPAPLRTAA